MLEAASGRKSPPRSITLYASTVDAAPDVEAWQRSLGVPVRLAGTWDWRTAALDYGIVLYEQRLRWRFLKDAAVRLRPAAWIAIAALGIHTFSLITDWAVLESQQRSLHRQMDNRFRAAVPEAVAVVDPALQMRRKLAEARHVAGLSDSGDFLPMLEQVAAGIKELPAGSVHVASYENGRLTLDLAGAGEAVVRRVMERLRQMGFAVDTGNITAAAGRGTITITVRSL
jgi:general secretion pathway protein L